ncbi:cupin domain-containing protein [Bacillus licheniformis]|nr:cupin domain-containing protein [Bacillus licheniformis]
MVKIRISKGGFLYVPPHLQLTFEIIIMVRTAVCFIQKRYQPLEGHTPEIVAGNVNNIKQEAYEGMKEVLIQDLLPKEIAYDMNIHILSFEPGASHGYIETHVQEHGAYILSGRGVYNLDNEWMPVDKGDYILWELIRRKQPMQLVWMNHSRIFILRMRIEILIYKEGQFNE